MAALQFLSGRRRDLRADANEIVGYIGTIQCTRFNNGFYWRLAHSDHRAHVLMCHHLHPSAASFFVSSNAPEMSLTSLHMQYEMVFVVPTGTTGNLPKTKRWLETHKAHNTAIFVRKWLMTHIQITMLPVDKQDMTSSFYTTSRQSRNRYWPSTLSVWLSIYHRGIHWKQKTRYIWEGYRGLMVKAIVWLSVRTLPPRVYGGALWCGLGCRSRTDGRIYWSCFTYETFVTYATY